MSPVFCGLYRIFVFQLGFASAKSLKTFSKRAFLRNISKTARSLACAKKEFKLQFFPVKCFNLRSEFLIPDPAIKKTHSKERCNLNLQQKEEKEKFIQYTSFLFEQHLSTSSKIYMHLQKFGFSSLCRPKTHFRDQQGHQRAGALVGSIIINKKNYSGERSLTSRQLTLEKSHENVKIGFQK